MNRIKISLTILFLSIFSFSFSQNFQSVEEINDACSQLGFASNEDAEIAVDNILEKIGLFKNFVLQECPNINNAVAKNIDIGNGKKERYILYDNAFFNRIKDKASNDWAAISILAHEIGHHLNGHALNNEGSNHRYELEADEFSGFVLAKMESSLSDAQSAIQTLRYEKATRTHPAKKDRLEAIERGWNRGMGIKNPKKKEVIVNDDNKVIEEVTVVEDDDEETDKMTAKKVLKKYINAIGGIENIMKIKTMKQYSTGVTNVPGSKGTTIKMTNTFLTPSKYLANFKMNILDSETESETLYLGSKIYSRILIDGKGDWNETAVTNDKQNEISYITEYSQLVSNIEMEYLGIQNKDGKEYHVVNLPNFQNIEINNDQYKNTTTQSQTKYFNTKTGLLEFIEQTNKIETKYKSEEMKNFNASNSSSFKFSFGNYKAVNGVLFPFETSVSMDELSQSSTTIDKIEINPEIDKELFKEK